MQIILILKDTKQRIEKRTQLKWFDKKTIEVNITMAIAR